MFRVSLINWAQRYSLALHDQSTVTSGDQRLCVIIVTIRSRTSDCTISETYIFNRLEKNKKYIHLPANLTDREDRPINCEIRKKCMCVLCDSASMCQ